MIGAGRRRIAMVIAAAVVVLAAACTTPSSGSGSGSGNGLFQFDGSVTDPAIPIDPLNVNFSFNPSGEPRGQLVVLFNGTGAGPMALSNLGQSLAGDGFHVIGLRYASGVGTASACPNSVQGSNPECHRQFRAEVVFGSGIADPDGASFDHSSVSVTAATSVVSRLQHAVQYLSQQWPTRGWDAYQVRSGGTCASPSPAYGSCELHWDDIVAMGHSQGAGVALYLGKHYPLARVAMLSGAYDAFGTAASGYDAAAWITEGGFAVPASRTATFSHLSDPAISLHRAVADAVGVPGTEVLTSAQARPYGFTGRLVTNATPQCPFDTAQSHNSTATDLCASASTHRDAWRYLASGI